MQALSNLTRGLVPAPYSDSQRGNGPVKTADLFTNIDRRADQLRKKNQMPNVCYGLALHAGIAGKTITPEAEQAVMASIRTDGNYGASYQRVMGITANNDHSTFLPQNIHESGVLNFRDISSGNLVHTAYLHRSENGELTLLHNNSLTLDMQMARGASVPVQHGGMTVYSNVGAMQNYLNAGYRFHFTPASHLNQAAAQSLK